MQNKVPLSIQLTIVLGVAVLLGWATFLRSDLTASEIAQKFVIKLTGDALDRKSGSLAGVFALSCGRVRAERIRRLLRNAH